MARKPRVYVADVDGVHEWAVAAPNQKAALEALGVGQNLFAQGLARLANDGDAVEAASACPGRPVRRLKGADEPFQPVDAEDASGWAAALAAAPSLIRRRPGPPSSPEAAPPPAAAKAAPVAAAPPARRAAKAPPKPRRKSRDRRPLMQAEAELARFEREAAKVAADIRREREALDRREARAEADLARRRQALQRAVDRARKAYDAG